MRMCRVVLLTSVLMLWSCSTTETQVPDYCYNYNYEYQELQKKYDELFNKYMDLRHEQTIHGWDYE